MKLHPAMKQANKVIRKAGFTFFPAGALSVKIYNGMFDGVHVDIELSRDADVGKLKVCQFSRNPGVCASARKTGWNPIAKKSIDQDFAKSFHQSCYDKAEAEAAKQLAM